MSIKRTEILQYFATGSSFSSLDGDTRWRRDRFKIESECKKLIYEMLLAESF